MVFQVFGSVDRWCLVQVDVRWWKKVRYVQTGEKTVQSPKQVENHPVQYHRNWGRNLCLKIFQWKASYGSGRISGIQMTPIKRQTHYAGVIVKRRALWHKMMGNRIRGQGKKLEVSRKLNLLPKLAQAKPGRQIRENIQVSLSWQSLKQTCYVTGGPCLEKIDLEGSKGSPGDSQGVLVVKNLPANAGDIRDTGSIPGLGRSTGKGHGNPLQYSCLENPMDRGAWWATVHGVAKSRTQRNY